MDQWINAIGTIAQVIIAFCALFLAYIASQEQISIWKGIKNFCVTIHFISRPPKEPTKRTPAFLVIIFNKGLTSQSFNFILTDTEKLILLGNIDEHKMAPGHSWNFFLDINPYILETLEESKALFLVNHFNKKKKFASKKDIQKLLKEYKEHINKKA